MDNSSTLMDNSRSLFLVLVFLPSDPLSISDLNTNVRVEWQVQGTKASSLRYKCKIEVLGVEYNYKVQATCTMHRCRLHIQA